MLSTGVGWVGFTLISVSRGLPYCLGCLLSKSERLVRLELKVLASCVHV